MSYLQRVGSLLGLKKKDADRRRQRRHEAFRGMRVLIIDDSRTVVHLISRMMSQNDFAPMVAASAEEGIELARDNPPDLIFLDIMLPGMNGFAALRQFRRDPVTASVPVVMISGDEHAMAQMGLERIGSDGFMKKPFGRAEVFQRIEMLVKDGRLPSREDSTAWGIAAE